MCRRGLVWCTLLIVSLVEFPSTSTRDVDKRELIQYKSFVNSTRIDDSTTRTDILQYNFHENSTKDNDKNVGLWYGSNLTKNHNENSQVPYEIHANSTDNINIKSNFTLMELDNNVTKNNDKTDSMLHDFYENLSGNQNYSVLNEMWDRRICIQLCCPFGSRLHNKTCIADNDTYLFPDVYDYETRSLQTDKKLNDSKFFHIIVRDPCPTNDHYPLNPSEEFMILTNGFLYQVMYEDFTDPTSYCLSPYDEQKYYALLCFNSSNEIETITMDYQSGTPVGLLVSLPFLLITFLVYSVLPDLQNMHGYTLRGYVGSLFIAYLILSILQLSPQDNIPDQICDKLAFVIYFSFLASFFWLNVMCFDIWWTFGGFRSLQGSAHQRERKKFIIYSIYAWGCASILTIICVIMDFVPGLPKNLIRPEFGAVRCWFTKDSARALYFYGPMSVTVVCNICLFISTALKIVQHKRDTAHQLSGSESRRHDDNKQWFNLYLKLFIVMGINWSMEIISALFKSAPQYVWYITDLTNTLQGLIIFIIFVWKDKIKRLLLKRFGCQERSLFSRNSNRSGYHSSTSRNRTTTTSVISLHEKASPLSGANYRVKNSSVETNCP